MREGAGVEPDGHSAERERRVGVARTALALGVLGAVAAVLPLQPVDGQQRLDATATTIPSSAGAPLVAGPPEGGEQPTAPEAEPTTTTTTLPPAPPVDPELADAVTEILEDLQEIAAAADDEPAPFLAEAFREAAEEQATTTSTTSTTPPTSGPEGTTVTSPNPPPDKTP